MDEKEMAVPTWRTVGELEKGDGLVDMLQHEDKSEDACVEVRTSWAARCLLYQYTMSFFALLFLLWHNGFFASARPTTRSVAGVPQYAIDYAPIVWLHKQEAYMPSDIYNQVENTLPSINRSSITDLPSPLTLENLDSLNKYGTNGSNVYLTSIVDVTTAPKWLNGVAPDSNGKTNGATSCAIIINDHGSGLVDVFYMYFYAYNQGNIVFGRELGDHIGDWEHNVIRFQDGQPTAIWYSQHGNGQAFTYRAAEKDKISNLRPLSYSAIGSHANYAIAGTHDHLIPDLNFPFGFLQDYTSQGKRWDPTLSAYFYTYDVNGTWGSIGGSPVGAMLYRGQWGDQQYPDSDARQPPPFLGFRKFVSGPTGPGDKQLNRTRICPDNGILCILRDRLGP